MPLVSPLIRQLKALCCMQHAAPQKWQVTQFSTDGLRGERKQADEEEVCSVWQQKVSDSRSEEIAGG